MEMLNLEISSAEERLNRKKVSVLQLEDELNHLRWIRSIYSKLLVSPILLYDPPSETNSSTAMTLQSDKFNGKVNVMKSSRKIIVSVRTNQIESVGVTIDGHNAEAVVDLVFGSEIYVSRSGEQPISSSNQSEEFTFEPYIVFLDDKVYSYQSILNKIIWGKAKLEYDF